MPGDTHHLNSSSNQSEEFTGAWEKDPAGARGANTNHLQTCNLGSLGELGSFGARAE